MKILVTGATGFIGRYVIRELLKYDHEIIATSIDREFNQDLPGNSHITYIPCDLNEPRDDYYELFLKPDICIHLSWQGLPNYMELFHIERNLHTNYFFIKSMLQKGLPNLSVIGTCYEYGLQNGSLSEDLETKPINPYGLAKDTLRKFIEMLLPRYQFNFKWIRLFYLYGEGQNKNSILEQLKRSLDQGDTTFNMSGGEQLRDYLPVEKVAEYIVKISLQDDFIGICNCCSGQPISIRKLVENYLAQNKRAIELNMGYYPYIQYEPMAFWGDAAKLNRILSLYK